MKITFIITKLDINGGGENLDILMKIRALQEAGHEISVVTAFSNLNYIPSAMSFNVFEEQAPRGGLLVLQIFIVKILKKYAAQTDVFYLVGSSFLFGAGWYRLGKSRPVVADLNGYADYVEVYYKKEPLYPKSYLPWRKNLRRNLKHAIRIYIERFLGVFLINRFDAIIFMTETIARYYQRVGVRRNKASVIPSFMDLKVLTSRLALDNPFLKFSKDSFNILCVGRFHIDKGMDLLIEAFSGVNFPNAKLHLVGDGPEKAVLEKIVKEKGLSDKVKFYPWHTVDGLAAFYKHADLFVHPARLPEPMVRTVVEAMSFGLPLVVTDTSSEPWVAEEVAKTFKLGDVADLRIKIETACQDKDFLVKARLMAEQRGKEFDYRNYVNQLSGILARLTGLEK